MQVYSRSQNKTKQTHAKTNEMNTRPTEHTEPRQADHRCCRRTGWHFRGGMAHMGSPTSGDTSPNSLLKDRNVGGFPHHHQQFKKKKKKKGKCSFCCLFPRTVPGRPSQGPNLRVVPDGLGRARLVPRVYCAAVKLLQS